MNRATTVRVGFSNERLAIELDGTSQLITYRRKAMLPFNRLANRMELVEFLELCLALYAADRMTLRPEMRWSRAFDITMPVWRLAQWRAARHDIEELFWRATGDEVTLRPIERRYDQLHHDCRVQHFELEHQKPTEIWLLSDGLDSLCGAAQAISAPGEHAAFLSVLTKTRAIPRLRKIRHETRKQYPNATEFYHLNLRLSRAPDIQEPTQRSRTLVAIASGLTVAAACGSARVNVAENGMGILNLPVSSIQAQHEASQVLHPANLPHWKLISEALLNGADVFYPNRYLTKAQMVARMSNWARELIRFTSSCDAPQRKDASEDCGVCFSCAYRKLALVTARCISYDTSYTSRPPKRSGFDPLDVFALQAEKLSNALAQKDAWAALTRLQPTLRTTPYGDETERAHIKLSTMELLRSHIDEVDALKALARAV